MKYNSRTFQNETVKLDGNKFVDCQFNDCVILYAGGDYQLEKVDLAGSNGFYFTGSAIRTLGFLSKICQAYPELGEKIFDGIRDGTITEPPQVH